MNIEDIRFADKRHNITADLAIAAITNSRQSARLAKALAAYRDKAHPTGFDSALIVDAKSGQIELFGFSADVSEKPYKATIPLSALDESSRLQRAMCRALGQLPVLKAP